MSREPLRATSGNANATKFEDLPTADDDLCGFTHQRCADDFLFASGSIVVCGATGSATNPDGVAGVGASVARQPRRGWRRKAGGIAGICSCSASSADGACSDGAAGSGSARG